MSDFVGLEEFLVGARVDPPVFSLRPGYRALLIAVTGVRGGPSNDASDAALRHAEESARSRLAGASPGTLPEIIAWREAFLGFGVKPCQARSSVEALLRRAGGRLPRIDRLTDLYSAARRWGARRPQQLVIPERIGCRRSQRRVAIVARC